MRVRACAHVCVRVHDVSVCVCMGVRVDICVMCVCCTGPDKVVVCYHDEREGVAKDRQTQDS